MLMAYCAYSTQAIVQWVEQAFALLKFRASPEMQEMVLIVIYALVASKIELVPLCNLN
jgi:hypothetical protein